MHRLGGTTGIYEGTPLGRLCRDAHTLRHHGFISESKLENDRLFLAQDAGASRVRPRNVSAVFAKSGAASR